MRENIWKNIKLGFKTNKLAVVGAAAIILLALISIFAFLYPVDPNAISATERLNAPSMAHLFGTDCTAADGGTIRFIRDFCPVFTEEEHHFWWASFPWCFLQPLA
jgi:hypothetical protein